MVIPLEFLHPFSPTETGNGKDFTTETGNMKGFSSEKEEKWKISPQKEGLGGIFHHRKESVHFIIPSPLKRFWGQLNPGKYSSFFPLEGQRQWHSQEAAGEWIAVLCSSPWGVTGPGSESSLLKAHWFPLSHCKIQGVFQKAAKQHQRQAKPQWERPGRVWYLQEPLEQAQLPFLCRQGWHTATGLVLWLVIWIFFFPSCHREFNKHSRVGEWVEAIKQSTAELIPPEGAERELCRAGTGEHKPWWQSKSCAGKGPDKAFNSIKPQSSLESGIKPGFGGDGRWKWVWNPRCGKQFPQKRLSS